MKQVFDLFHRSVNPLVNMLNLLNINRWREHWLKSINDISLYGYGFIKVRDEDGNFCFYEFLCEEDISEVKIITASTDQPELRKRSLQSVAKDMILEKFLGRNFSAARCSMFKKECLHVGLVQGQFSKCIHLFLEGAVWTGIQFLLN